MKNILNKLKQIDWVEYSVQFFLVLISIIIAFNVENYREFKQERRVEHEYLESMVDELEEDLKYFEGEVFSRQYKIGCYDYLLDNKPEALAYNDTIVHTIFNMYSIDNNFSPMDITYTSMKTSGKLELIENKEIRKQIIVLYHRFYQLVYRKERDYTQMTMNMPERMSRIYSSDPSNQTLVFKYPELLQVLEGEKRQEESQMSIYKWGIDGCTKLIDLINEELEGRGKILSLFESDREEADE